jgi:antitoxin component YwqK of YwqJK toxin-antitoxin module
MNIKLILLTSVAIITLTSEAIGQTQLSKSELKKLQKEYYIENVRELVRDNNSELFLIQATKKPTCYNNFSFLTDEEKQKNKYTSLIILNTNVNALEVIPVKYSKENGLIIEGNYRLFKLGKTLTDTAFLWASYHFKNDKRDGLAEIWDASKNGKTGIAPFIKMNYLNDKLYGYSEMFYPDGKLAVSAEFKNGYVDGEVIAYNYPPNHNPFEPDYLIKSWVHSGGILSIYQIGDFKETIYENINTVKKNGGNFEYPKQYEQYTKIRYKVDSMATNGKWFKGSVPAEDFYQFCNGKPITKYFINKEKSWIPSELFYFDSKGAVVYSLSKAKGEVIKKAVEIEVENQKYLNTEVKCSSCNNKVLVKNAKENWGGCNCIQNNGELIEVYGTVRTYFCSIQCKVIYEKDCCKRSGYFYER